MRIYTEPAAFDAALAKAERELIAHRLPAFVLGRDSAPASARQVETLPNGDVCVGDRVVWKNDVTVGYRGDSVRSTQVHFITCLREGTPFETGGREYLHTFAAVEAAYRSIEEHREIALPEIGSLAVACGELSGKPLRS